MYTRYNFRLLNSFQLIVRHGGDRRQRAGVVFSSREKLNARRRAHRQRANNIITKFPSNTSQSKSISLRDERNPIPLLCRARRGEKQGGETRVPAVVKAAFLRNTVKIYSGATKRVSFVVRTPLYSRTTSRQAGSRETANSLLHLREHV